MQDTKMKAIVYEKYGPPEVLQLKDVERPSPKKDEVLVEVVAASVNFGDLPCLRGEPLQRLMGGLLKPKNKILGDDIAGRVEAVGGNIKRFQPGDEVFGISVFGAFAEYCCVIEDNLGRKPTNLSFEDAASVPMAALVALQSLRDHGQIQPGSKVLIVGASGGVGTFAVQMAKSFGADVTGVCSTSKLDLVRSIGASQVIDYTQEDFTKSGQHYDLIFSTGGYYPLSVYRRVLNPKGIYVCAGGSYAQYFQALILGPLISMIGGKKLGAMYGKPNQSDWAFLKELLESGKVVPVIDRKYPLNQVPEALRYLEGGHARGKIVITVEHDNQA
jgi:NADPH:quinone reductase-like Zn-dependent oxidoreductase